MLGGTAAWDNGRMNNPSSGAGAGVQNDEDLATRLRNAMRGCTRRLSGTTAAGGTVRDGLGLLTDWIASDEASAAAYGIDGPADVYGDGIVRTLERRVAELLGTEDAAYFPSGTMAQQVALRCWAEQTGGDVVATHPLAHLEVHERHAFRDLTGLRGVWPTAEPRMPTADEVRSIAGRFGTLSLELPLRDAGFVLPAWDELVETTSAARERGARVHFDGARLWETTVHFGRPLDQIAALADSVYVSFYKSLGGISGAAVGGPAEFVETMKTWRHRYGGQVYQQWPSALSALIGLDRELPRLVHYVEYAAKTVAGALAEAAVHTRGVRVFPEHPHTHQFRLFAPFEAQTLRRAALEQIAERGVGFVDRWSPAQVPGVAFAEVTIASPALDWSAEDITSAFVDLLERAARIQGPVRPL